MFPYDDVAPVVTLSVATTKLEDTPGGEGMGLKLVDVGLTIEATDACTPNPNVTVRVYSDELYLCDADSWKARTVQLSDRGRSRSSDGLAAACGRGGFQEMQRRSLRVRGSRAGSGQRPRLHHRGMRHGQGGPSDLQGDRGGGHAQELEDAGTYNNLRQKALPPGSG